MANLFIFSLLIFVISVVYGQENVQVVPAMYIFGDSTVDEGNAFGGMKPAYGKSIADHIASFLGLLPAPAYGNMTDAQKASTITGVNYGYGGTGILPETFYPFMKDWNYTTFDQQISNFHQTVAKDLPQCFGHEELVQHLSDSIFLISFGINDYAVNYLPPSNSTWSTVSPPIFADVLLEALSSRLTRLYNLGARRMLVNNIWPMGCMPSYAHLPSDPMVDGCNMTINEMVLPYSSGLPSLLNSLSSNLSGSFFSHSDNFEWVRELKRNPGKYGITNTRSPCTNDSKISCSNSLYYDQVHTTDAANRVFAENCFKGSLCLPMNIVGLVNATSN